MNANRQGTNVPSPSGESAPSLATRSLPGIGLEKNASAGAVFDLAPDEVLEYQSRRESSARSYPRRLPLAIQSAEGVWVRDTRGQVFLDCLAGAGSLPLGYNHPELNHAIRRQLENGIPYQTLDLATPLKIEFMRELLDFLPREFAADARLQFCGPTGSDAVEAAIKLAKLHTGRTGIAAFHGGYHGMTSGSLSLTGNISLKQRRHGLMPDVRFFPYPYSLRCPFGLGGEAGARTGLTYIESVLDDVESGAALPAAFVVEPIQGEGGVIPAPEFWLQELRRITRERGILLILDEIQSGFARSGKRFAFEHAGIVPDCVVMSKAIGGGLPLAVIAFDVSIDAWRGGEHAGTFRGNQLAMATGLVTMRVIRRDNLAERAATLGERLVQQLRQIDCDCIGEVRGHGLMVGVEIVHAGQRDKFGRPAPAGELAARIQHEALRRGLIVEKGGRHGCVLRFLPPLVIQEEEIDVIAERLRLAIQESV